MDEAPDHQLAAFKAMCAESILPEHPVRVGGRPETDRLQGSARDYSIAAETGAVMKAMNVVWREQYPLSQRPSFADMTAFLAWDNERAHAAADAGRAARQAERARQAAWLAALPSLTTETEGA